MDKAIISNGLILLALLITTISQIKVTSSYNKYKKKLNSNDLTGFDTARKILDKNGLNDIMILETRGNLSDHYDPKRKVIKLSTDIYHGSSIASIAVAAHECGHAIQDKVNYTPMRIRSKLVPIVNLCTKIGYFAIIIGAVFSYALIEVGIILLLSMLAFQLITLPVEFNASKRALEELKNQQLTTNEEEKYTKKMLSSAAFTYVAALLSTMLQILRYVVIFTGRSDD